jgi:dihydrofolate reductase
MITKYPIAAIVAMNKQFAIGKDNQLLWHLPDDLRAFKALTLGAAVLMGRKTYQSIGRPLPQRRNIVVTRNPVEFAAPGCIVVGSVEEGIAKAGEQAIFIIGGAEIYAQAMPYITKLYISLVEAELAADTFFPTLDWNDWREVSRVYHPVDEKHRYPFTFLQLERIVR